MTTLKVLVDGRELETEEGVAFWKRFSAWMDEHEGDLAGFARSEGLVSVRPEMHGGGPVLVASHREAQKPYVTAPKRGGEAPKADRGTGKPARKRR
jgi:hypothetical protein